MPSSTSAIAAAAASEETPAGGSLMSDYEGALASVRVGAILHPAVLFALADCAGLLQH